MNGAPDPVEEPLLRPAAPPGSSRVISSLRRALLALNRRDGEPGPPPGLLLPCKRDAMLVASSEKIDCFTTLLGR